MHDDYIDYCVIIIILILYLTCAHIKFSEQSFYRSVIVYVSLASSFLGLSAIIIMKILELLKDRRSKKCKDSESESHSKARTNYGSIQKGR